MKSIHKKIANLQAQALRRGFKRVVKRIDNARTERFDAVNSEFPEDGPRLVAQGIWWRNAIYQMLKLSDLELAKLTRKIHREHRFYLTNKKYQYDTGYRYSPTHNLLSALFWYESRNIVALYSTIHMPKPVYDSAQKFAKETGYWYGVTTMDSNEVFKIEMAKLKA